MGLSATVDTLLDRLAFNCPPAVVAGMLASTLQAGIVQSILESFVAKFEEAVPALLAGIVFLVVAVGVVKLLQVILRGALRRAFPDRSDVYRQFVVTIVSVFLWFGVALTFLSVVGLGGLAASLGTATGFVALGVAYALSEMIEDVVAGIYLLQDPDFMPGDTVTIEEMTGEVRSIELRKTRFEVDDDVVVRANADIEKQWRKRETEQ